MKCELKLIIDMENVNIKSAVSEQHVTVSKEEKEEKLIEYLMGLYSRPSYVKEDVFDFEETDDCLYIYMFGGYRITINKDEDYSATDVAAPEEGCGYGKDDLLYAYRILCNRDEIIEIWNS